MDIREVLIDWTTPSGRSGLSVFHFGTEAALSLVQGTLTNALNALRPGLHAQTTYQVRAEVRIIDDTTGLLVATDNFGSPPSNVGSSTVGEVVPDACQGLVRWETAVIAGGRRLRGRTFIPGLADDRAAGNGEISAGMGTVLGNFATQMQGGSNTLRIFSRPRPTGGGYSGAVTGASYWDEFAVLRRRR